MEGREFESLYKVCTKIIQKLGVFFTSCSFEESFGKYFLGDIETR